MEATKHAFILGSFVTSCTAMVDRFPKKGESFRANGFILEAGGKGFNLITALQALKINAEAIVAIGDDLAGQLAQLHFSQIGLAPHYLVQKSGQTGGGICFTDQQGETSLAIFNGANDRLCAADIAAKHNIIASAFLTAAPFEIPDEAIIAAFSIARDHGRLTLLNPSPFRPISPHLLSLTNILVVNEVEAQALLGSLPPSPNDAPLSPYAALGVDHLIITLGARGADYFHRGQFSAHSAARPSEVVDTLGAGDAFTSGLIAGMAHGLPIKSAMQIAHICAGQSTQIAGTSAAYRQFSSLDIPSMASAIRHAEPDENSSHS